MLVGAGQWAGTGNGHSKVAKQGQTPLGVRYPGKGGTEAGALVDGGHERKSLN